MSGQEKLGDVAFLDNIASMLLDVSIGEVSDLE